MTELCNGNMIQPPQVPDAQTPPNNYSVISSNEGWNTEVCSLACRFVDAVLPARLLNNEPVSAIRAPRSTLPRRLLLISCRLPDSTTRRSERLLRCRRGDGRRLSDNGSTGDGGSRLGMNRDTTGDPSDDDSDGGGTEGYESEGGGIGYGPGGCCWSEADDGGVVLFVFALT